MLSKLQRAYRLWKLSDKDENYLKAIETLTDKEIDAIPNKGNGKATFIPLMNETERNEYLKNQEPVWRKFNERLKEIIK